MLQLHAQNAEVKGNAHECSDMFVRAQQRAICHAYRDKFSSSLSFSFCQEATRKEVRRICRSSATSGAVRQQKMRRADGSMRGAR